ncbi:SdpI family protein [Bacillus solitudinis]|uniref:hypothetical protein n=1 Tax=Bacillus solitudinis TaxID=2014074 RepID=UPI000C243006|nr:hypothetical protein [Bacillus solitudinis]
MIKKSCMIFLIFLAFGVSLYTSNITIEEGMYGSSEVLLFSIPFTMVLVISNLFILPKMTKLQGFYDRFKNGLENIYLALTTILFVLHCGLLLQTKGIEVNLLLLIPISVGIVLITTANTLPRFQYELNQNASQLGKSTNQVWNAVIRPFSLPLFIGGIVMLFCVFLPGVLMLIVFFTILACTLFVSILCSYKAYKNTAN